MNKLTSKTLSILSISIGMASMLTPLGSHAQSLQEVYRLAVISDPLLQQAGSKLISSRENIVQAKAALLPSIDGELKSSWNDDSNASPNNSKSYEVSLRQPVYSPALSSGYKKVKIIDTQAQLQHQQSQQDLIIRTVDAYINSMIAKSNLSTAQAQERAIKQRLDTVNAEFEVGVIAITDVHEAKASYDNAKVDLIISEGKLQNSFEALQRLTGQTITDVDSLNESYATSPLAPADPQHWISLALANNKSVLLANYSIDSAREDTSIASSNTKPSVDLTASHSRTDHSVTGQNTNNRVSLVLSVPLFNAGSLNSKIRQALSAEDIAKSQQQDTIRAVTQTIRSLTRDIQTNSLAIAAREQSIISSRAALAAISEGFKVGTRNIVDLLQAEQALFSAENDHATARLEHLRLQFKLDFQLGSVADADIAELAQFMDAS
ncbi:hypothetical protein A9R01_06295 ['Osedax' symbiont bacterium Rs2_46_30_T18]|nr:hypothetical protein A9R01_06295 ['Osedax' symbiont bacterium Rs2_46_30_T18]